MNASRPATDVSGRTGIALILAALVLLPAPSRGQSPLEDSDALLGVAPKARLAAPAAARPLRIGHLDQRAVLHFHPLMRYLVSSWGNRPLLYFVPPEAQKLATLFGSRRAARLETVRTELEQLQWQRIRVSRDLAELGPTLNREVSGQEPSAATGPEKAVEGKGAQAKAAEDRYWKRRGELEQRMVALNEQIAALEAEAQDPMTLLKQTREAILTKMQRELREVIEDVASRKGYDLILDARQPGPARTGLVEAPEDPMKLAALPTPGSNEYEAFLSGQLPQDSKEPNLPAARLLQGWAARSEVTEGRLWQDTLPSVLHGGDDLTWTVMKSLLSRYEVPASKVALLEKYFSSRQQR